MSRFSIDPFELHHRNNPNNPINQIIGKPLVYKENTIEQQLQQAHRAGWEQCKREAELMAIQKAGHVGFPVECCQEDYENYLIASSIADAIASMTYREAQDDTN